MKPKINQILTPSEVDAISQFLDFAECQDKENQGRIERLEVLAGIYERYVEVLIVLLGIERGEISQGQAVKMLNIPYWDLAEYNIKFTDAIKELNQKWASGFVEVETVG